MAKRRKKSKGKRCALIIILFILLCLCSYEVFMLISSDSNKELERLGYSEDAINIIRDKGLEKVVIEKESYSKTLETAILSDEFEESNIDLYYLFEYKNDDRFIKNLNSLVKLGYDKTQITEIFDTLSFDDIDTLINHSYVSDISEYIKYNYFDINKLDRYISYKNSNDIDYEKCVTYVNIGLDKEYYTDYKMVKNPDDLLVLVNKYNFLSSDYVPSDLVVLSGNYSLTNVKMRKVAAEKFEELSRDASVVGLSILGMSGYRSYSYQNNLYNRYKREDPNGVDTYSARPGASEHQTGLALDVATRTTTYTNFGRTKEYVWLKDNAHKYGFIIRYTENAVKITGYKTEEWHIRYVGEEVAKYIYDNNITYDEYYVKFIDKKM